MVDTKQRTEWSPATEWTWRFYKMLLHFFYSPITPWFFLGMATEALGIAIQDMLGWPYYPVIDFLIGVIIGMFLLYWQAKHPREEGREEEDDE